MNQYIAGGVIMDRKSVVNIGEQRFNTLIEENKFYIDKTDFIREWWETGSTVTLITRPRRFGKTLNMSMLECFFQEICGQDRSVRGTLDFRKRFIPVRNRLSERK